MEELDHYYACTSPDGSILAGAGIKADIIKCVAVAPSARSEGFMLPLLSRVVSDAAAKGVLNLKVFTKPENREIFESAGYIFVGVLGYIFLKEKFTAKKIIGMLLIMLGIVIFSFGGDIYNSIAGLFA